MTQPQKKMFKVLAILPRHDNQGNWFMKVGSGFENRDGSINMTLDVVPVGGPIKLQIRELDARDLAQRDAYRTAQGTGANSSGTGPAASRAATAFPYEPDAAHGTGSATGNGSANEAVPF